MTTNESSSVPLWRVALVGDLTLLSLAVAAFAYLPLFPPEPGEPANPLTGQELAITIAGVLVALGLLTKLLPWYVPGARWAYLGSSVLALITAGIFFLSPPFHMPTGVAVVIGLVLASNVIGGAAAHMVDGGGDDSLGRGQRDRPHSG